ncbi:30S ribosomal protein S15 [Candidatus Pacearchaeota archaeon CG06_land_8_20_14_3_00_35_12]|nr:MAG: 30S ribosomal protein S15 [Candidatus Pacearchaeota archaeon CG06_land_8_20_14_3_00_35_12]
MATLYGRGKGKAGSHPPEKRKPLWMKRDAKEIQELIVELSKENEPPKIGLILRDNYGVPSIKVATGKTISQILKEEKKEAKIPYDLANLVKKATKLEKHFEKNKQDKTAKRGLQLTKAKILRLAKYYKRKKKIPADWTF